MTIIKLIARSVLSHAQSLTGAGEVRLSPGGNLLACATPLWTAIQGGTCNQTAIDLWSIRNPENPRSVLRMKTRLGYVVDGITMKETESSTVCRLLLSCRSSFNSTDPIESYVECYDVDLTDSEPTLLSVDSQYERIVSESRQHIPPFAQWDIKARTGVRVISIAGDVISCTMLDFARPRGDHDESAGPHDVQLNPQIPLPGFEQVYLVHLSAPAGRWLHPRHVESFINAQAYIHANHLYLLGRTPSTFVVRDYHFSEDMLLPSTGYLDMDNILDLGSPLAECASAPIPDFRLPFGSCDRETVHFDPAHGFTILQLHDWWGAGQPQVLHLPLPKRQLSGEHPLRSAVLTLASPHLPDGSYFGDAWLGRNRAIMYSEDDYDSNLDVFFRLTFNFGPEGPNLAGTIELPETASLVIRDDLICANDDDVGELWNARRTFAFDERSGRLCLTRGRPGGQTLELFVFTLED